ETGRPVLKRRDNSEPADQTPTPKSETSPSSTDESSGRPKLKKNTDPNGSSSDSKSGQESSSSSSSSPAKPPVKP
ncbi:MAG TPA: hypothetical protein PLK30_26585, partial [Blastocatellia bacterium]|nr:hypothetical protein [Blastocatellia bacterium]